MVGPASGGRSGPYASILPGGGDTASPLSCAKRLTVISGAVDLRGRKVLDAGCGAGGYLPPLLALGADARGIELDGAKVARFKHDHPGEAGRVLQGDLAHMPYPDGTFDLVILNEVLEHTPDDDAVLAEARRVLARHALVIIFSPNRLYPFETHGVTLRRSRRPLPPAVPLIPYIPLSLGGRLLTYGARNYLPHELRRKVRRAGFAITHTGYVWQTFENISGRQPRPVAAARPVLRALAAAMERIPLIRALGVSQLVVARAC